MRGFKKNIIHFCCSFVMLMLFAAESPSIAAEENQLVLPETGSSQTYIIGKGDILKVVVWKEPELSVESTTVRLDGKITLPLLNDVQAEGLSTMELKTDVEKELEKYIDSPIVTIILVEPVSKKYYILGEIQNTGEYPLLKNMTVMQAFAVAGGFTEWASKNEIILFRVVDGQEKMIRIKYKNLLKGKKLKNNIPIQADDTIVVP